MTSRLHYNIFPSANLNKFFLVCFLFIAGHAYAQPGIEYDKIHDKTYDMRATRIATRDGGFLIFGTVLYNINYHIAKYNAAAALEWEKTYQGNQSDFLTSVIQTSDGGYLLGGDSNSTKGLDKSENTFDEDEYVSRDYWVIKITADGTKQWDRTLGGAKAEKLTSLLQTSDGEYLIGGYSDSPVSAVKTEPAILFDPDYENDYSNDYWVVKLTSNGAVKWDKTIGGNKEEYLSAMLPAPDGGYLLAGSSSSGIGHDKVTDNRGGLDYWIVKITSAGVKVSEKVFGGSNSDSVVGFEPTADGGFILGGNSVSEPSGDKTSQHFGPADYPDYWLIKVNAALDKQWDRTLGGSGYDVLVSIKQTPDGGYIIGGNSQSEPGGTRTAKRKGEQDIWIVKTNADGVSLWDKSLADAETYGTIISVDPVSDGGYLVQVLSDSDLPSGEKTSRGTGLWEIKLLADFNHNKLSFSKRALAFTLLPYAPKPATPQSINLSANAGNPAVSFVKNAPDTWVLLPIPALGALPVSVNGSKFRPGNYSATVTAIAPGYERAILPISLLTADTYTPPILLPIGNMVLIEKRPLTFTATANVRPGQTKIFSLENAPEGAAINASTGEFTWLPATPGVYKFTVKVTGSTSPLLTDEEEITVTVLSENANDIIRINAGGGAYTTLDGREFVADQYFYGEDRTSSIDTADILNTEDDELYRSGRATNDFGYKIPMRNGIVKVTLHFAEIYWGVSPIRPGGLKQRRFWVNAEDKTLLHDYDIIAAAGGTLTAVQESFEVSVSDGVLDLSFYSNKDLARISAIEIERVKTQTTTTLAPVADAFVRKAEFSDSNFGSELTLDCKNGTRENLYRESYLKFSLAPFSQISAAKLRIYGYNYEGGRSISMDVTGMDDDAWTENGITAANAPKDAGIFLGNIRVKQQKQYLEIDVTNFVKAQLAGDKSLTLMIKATGPSNARVVFNSRENSDNPPQLEIITTGPVTSQARLAYKETMTENEDRINASSVYPNPVVDRIMVNVSDRHSADVELQLLNVSGTSYQAEAESQIVPGGKVEINISNLALHSGLYLLKVHSEKYSEVLKVLVAQ